MPLTQRFASAFEYAFELHRKQTRKGVTVPYISHLMSVASLVLEHGGGEDEAIAALLHDAVEDQGGPPVLAEIRRRFGDNVAGIVDECTDSDSDPKPPWRARKEAYLAHLSTAGSPSLLVSAADKLHNARSLLIDYRSVGEELWGRFNGGREGTLWYYRSLADRFSELGPEGLAAELRRVMDELETLAGDEA